VVLEPGVSCRNCEWCRTGRYNLCASMNFISMPPEPGVLRTYVAHPASLCFQLPESLSSEEGALIEPLAVALGAVKKSGASVGDKATVLGSGCIGLMTLLSLKAVGAADISVVDIHDIRLEKAKQLGAAHTINASTDEPVSAVRDLYGGTGPHLVFAAAGSQKTAVQMVRMARPGGTLVQVGNVAGETPFPLLAFTRKELRLLSVYRYANTFPAAIAVAASRQIDISQIISRIYDFEETGRAYEDGVNDKESLVKAVIRVSS